MWSWWQSAIRLPKKKVEVVCICRVCVCHQCASVHFQHTRIHSSALSAAGGPLNCGKSTAEYAKSPVKWKQRPVTCARPSLVQRVLRNVHRSRAKSPMKYSQACKIREEPCKPCTEPSITSRWPCKLRKEHGRICKEPVKWEQSPVTCARAKLVQRALWNVHRSL